MGLLQTLILTVTLAGGYSPDYTKNMGYGIPVVFEDRYTLDAGLELAAPNRLFFLGGLNHISAQERKHFEYIPIQQDFNVFFGILLEDFEVGVKSKTSIPVMSASLTIKTSNLFYEQETNFYIKWKKSFKF